MSRPLSALAIREAVVIATAALALLPLARVCVAQAPLAPELGVLALRNGHIIHGHVTRAGDYYVVTNGEGSELRLKNDDVESFCANLQETYELKRRHLTGINARPHLELARWCLRHELFDECRQQLDTAERHEPGSPQVAELKRRLELALEAPVIPAPAAAAPQIPLESVESALAALPRGSVEKFGAIVQPILLNRCAANQCHGPNSKSEFKLLRPPPGQIASRRFTQRNLYATLRYLDRTSPDASPLITLPQQRHGSSLTPVFDKHTVGQLAEVVAWVRTTVAPSSAAAHPRPATVAPKPQALSQPVIDATPAAPATAAAENATAAIRVMRPTDSLPSNPPAERPAQTARRDPYDPAFFNDRYHSR